MSMESPEEVRLTTKEYKIACESLRRFIEGALQPKEGAEITTSDMRKLYEDWYETDGDGEEKLGTKTFGIELKSW